MKPIFLLASCLLISYPSPVAPVGREALRPEGSKAPHPVGQVTVSSAEQEVLRPVGQVALSSGGQEIIDTAGQEILGSAGQAGPSPVRQVTLGSAWQAVPPPAGQEVIDTVGQAGPPPAGQEVIDTAGQAAVDPVEQAAPSQLKVLVPESAGSGPQGGDLSHTRLRVLVVPNAASSTTSQFNTPSTIRSVYSLPATGGSSAIAIVDSYHFPTALADFNAFSKYFGLPQETSTTATVSGNKTFQVVYATGYAPQSGGNYISSWNLEAALDIEWAHAMAPNAKIYLVEAASASNNDLYNAVRVAAALPGVKEVSMSWGGSETSYEAMFYDPIFTAPGIVYLASGGDTSDLMEYPAASPNVVSCGGTSINRNTTTGAFLSETGWADAGCGPSVYEPRPSYQNGVASVVGAKRGVSDISFDSDPNTGVYVFDSTPLWGGSGWWILGGTSVASPSLAGVINLAASSGNGVATKGGVQSGPIKATPSLVGVNNQAATSVNGFAANTAAEEARIYGNLGNANAFRDITSGTDGTYTSKVGYDFITGVGSPIGLVGK